MSDKDIVHLNSVVKNSFISRRKLTSVFIYTQVR